MGVLHRPGFLGTRLGPLESRPFASKQRLRTDHHKAIQAVLVASRREKKLTQKGLAKPLGHTPSYVAKLEIGER
jgi:hypothetical protein